jgi:hypothetical protein
MGEAGPADGAPTAGAPPLRPAVPAPLCALRRGPGGALHTLCACILRHLAELFVFVVEQMVPADNGAERSLRHLVTSRKISAGTHSARGTDTKMLLSSLFGSWRAQRLNSDHV